MTSCGCAFDECLRCDESPDPRPKSGTFEQRDNAVSYPYYAVGHNSPASAPVLLLHELPGLTPGAIDLADFLHLELNRRCYMPLLFGEYGQSETGLTPLLQACQTGRWKVFNCTWPGRILDDSWSMTSQVAEKHPEEAITVIGNCLTGTLPLELIAHPKVEVAIHCQPALPFGLTRKNAAWPIDGPRLERSLDSLESIENKRLIFIHYVGDSIAPVSRIRWLLDQIEMRNPELLNQVDLLIAAECQSNAKAPFSAAQQRRVIYVEVDDQNCHPTITGAKESDRQALRSALIGILRDNE